MKKMIVVLAFLLVHSFPCFAAPFSQVIDNDPIDYVVTGTIEAMGTNSVDIRDEDDKTLKHYVYFGQDVEIGDHVRAHYDPVSLRIDLLKKMTKLKYNKDGQNLGYTTKEEKTD